jgi:hypothetical protein
MSKRFKRGDHVRWNSEAGVVSGVIVKKNCAGYEVQGIYAARVEE